MAKKDLYESRQMYQGPWLLFLLIPIGVVAFVYLADFCFDVYYKNKTINDTKLVLEEMLTLDSLEDEEDYREFAIRRFKDLDYDPDPIKIEFIDKYIVLFVPKAYFSVIDEIFHGSTKVTEARIKGSYNEYKEIVIEEWTKDDEEKYFGTEDDTEVPDSLKKY